jgi:hypothetical protein
VVIGKKKGKSMFRLSVTIQARDTHKIVAYLEGIQWEIAGGAIAGPGWELVEDA